jgi:hypothetical protein
MEHPQKAIPNRVFQLGIVYGRLIIIIIIYGDPVSQSTGDNPEGYAC